MSLDLWLSFTIATIALVALPGPTVMIVVSFALGRGRKTAWATVPGVVLGDFVAMTVSLLGAGAVLAASATLFTILKLVGAAYLFWLGFQLWRSPAGIPEAKASKDTNESRKMFLKTFTITALNPKGIIFFVAFVPQFVDLAEPVFIQFAILEVTFVSLAAFNALLWALLANKLRNRIKSPKTQSIVSRISGSCLMAAGFLTAVIRRTA